MAAPAKSSDLPELTAEYIAYTNAPNLLAQTGAVYALALAAVILRFYVRVFKLRFFGKDDWVMLLATVSVVPGSMIRVRLLSRCIQSLATATFVCYVQEMSLGLGRHMAVIQMNEKSYRELLKVRQIHMVCVMIGISVVKISACLFLLRLTASRAHVWFLNGLVVFMMAFTVACTGTLGMSGVNLREHTY